jgi:hypothetical protein
MLFPSKRQQPDKLLTIGLMSLAVANVAGYFMRRNGAVPESVADPLTGFLMGVAIALTLLGIRRQVKARREGNGNT